MHTLTTRDGLALQLHDWPAPPPPRGRVLIVHGLGEHAARYAHVAAALNDAGWHAGAFDLRGHGRSGGARGAMPTSESMLEDLAQVLDALPRSEGPLVLLGHSMGGLIAARFVAEGLSAQPAAWSRAVDALVLSSPALDAGLNGAEKLLLALLGPLAPNLAVGNGLKSEWVSRDPAVVRAYDADPLGHDRVTARLVRFIIDGGALVRERAPQWRVPTLLMWAGADRCVSPAGSAEFAGTAPADRVQSRVWAPLYHELFNEPERGEVLAHLLAWLDGLSALRAPGAAVTPA